MISLTDHIVNPAARQKAIERFREKGIVLPTFAQMRNPELVPEKIKETLKNIGLWDLHPANLFRITWKNEPVAKGGLFGGVNYIEIPEAISGVKTRIILLVGKYFPTGAHKVGAAYGCLAPRIISGEFDPSYHKAVWPSTGNYCRGGAFDSYLMGVTAVAILPEEMSKERFSWLRDIGAEVIATPGCESNVKEIYDKCWDIRRNRPDCVIFNQFDEFGNPTWHYNVTAPAIEEVYNSVKSENSQLAAYVSATGSAGTIGAGDYLKKIHPHMKIVASEALQCPTLLTNGFGGHRIEGIGDKHVPWVHNVKNTDFITAIDDNAVVNLARLFNEEAGKDYLAASGVEEDVVNNLDLLGFSSISNVLSAIKFAKYNELTSTDIVLTVLTDSMELYNSRLHEMHEESGEYVRDNAIADDARYLKGIGIDYMQELGYRDRKRIHNLKYYTWIEQQGRTYEEIMDQWYDPDYWTEIQSQGPEIDALIEEFNRKAAVKL